MVGPIQIGMGDNPYGKHVGEDLNLTGGLVMQAKNVFSLELWPILRLIICDSLGSDLRKGWTIPVFHVLDNYLSMKDLVHHKFIIYTSSQIGLHKIITRNNEN